MNVMIEYMSEHRLYGIRHICMANSTPRLLETLLDEHTLESDLDSESILCAGHYSN